MQSVRSEESVFGLAWSAGTVLALLFGSFVGLVLSPVAILFAYPVAMLGLVTDPEELYLIGFLTAELLGIGLAVGLVQWAVLRRRINRSGWWVVTTALGFLVGPFAGYMVGVRVDRVGLEVLAAVWGAGVTGVVLGAVQWLILRRSVERSWRWIAASGATFALAYAVGLIAHALVDRAPSEAGVPGFLMMLGSFGLGGRGFLVMAAALGITTAVAMGWLLKLQPRRTAPAPAALMAVVLLGIFFAAQRGGAADESIATRSLSLGRPDETVFALAWSPDGTRLASGGRTGSRVRTVRIWGLASKTIEATLSVYYTDSLAWSADGRYFLTDHELWDAASWQRIKNLGAPWDGIAVFSANGHRIAVTGFKDGLIRVLDGGTGNLVTILRADSKEGPRDVAWSRDGRFIAAAGEDGYVRIWKESGELAQSFNAHPGDVGLVKWSPDGRRLASAALSDGDVQIWDLGAGRLERVLPARVHLPTGLAWSADGAYLAVASGRVLIWQVDSWREVADLQYPTKGPDRHLPGTHRCHLGHRLESGWKAVCLCGDGRNSADLDDAKPLTE